jgi:predicted phosphoribosyltransferase
MFDDRSHAGRSLGRLVAERVRDAPVVVLALPRGGVPVGIRVAECLDAAVRFDVFLVRKLGVPNHEELAFGAIASGGVRVLNRAIIDQLGLSTDDIEQVTRREQAELKRREQVYREGRPPVQLQDRVVVLVDDGLATGASMIAAVRAVRQQQPKSVVVAVPVASQQSSEELSAVADDVICFETRDPFYAVGYWYRDFEQVGDEEVRLALRRFTPGARELASTPHSAHQTDDSAGST